MLPTLHLIAASVLDGGMVPAVELISRGGILEGDAEVESSIPSRRLSYVEFGYDS